MEKGTQGRSPNYYAWRRFLRNKPAVGGLCIIVLSAIIALLGYLVTPDPTPHANNMILELETHSPGHKAKILRVHRNQNVESRNIFHRMLFGQPNKYRDVPITDYRFEEGQIVVKRYVGLEGEEGMEERYSLANVVFPLQGGEADVRKEGDKLIFVHYDGTEMQQSVSELVSMTERSNLVERRYLLGTDRFGRDMLSRLILGTRISLSVGFIAVFISLVIGITIGALGGFFRGGVDNFVMWLINVVWSVPALLLVIALTMVIGEGFWQVFVAVGLTMWVEIARIVRGQIISIREKEFVEAAYALGYGNLRIISRHLIPNVMSPVIVIAAVNFATAILLEAGLSFLGVGVQPPMPSWGVMINDHFGYVVVDAAYLAILPGLAIIVMVLAFNLLGNGMRDALDVQMR